MPSSAVSTHPVIYLLPLIIVGVIAFVLFRPDPNMGSGDELEKANEIARRTTSIPGGVVIPSSESTNKIIIKEIDNRGIMNSENVELVSLKDLVRNDGPVDFSNPLQGFWGPQIVYADNKVRLRFTRTFICEIYMVNDPEQPDSVPFNLRKVGQVPYKIRGAEKLKAWEKGKPYYYLPEFEVVVEQRFQNRDGSEGSSELAVNIPLRFEVKGDQTPSDVDDFVIYSFRSQLLNSAMLTQALKLHSMAIPLNTLWVRKLPADWRDGVDVSGF